MWDAALYLRFGGERARPFFDLLARVGAELPGYVVDMGCGPGNLTALLAERVERVRMFGSAALDLAWVAEGRTDATVMLANKPWDTAAGVLLAREAGALVLDSSGESHSFQSPDTIAAASGVVDAIVAVVSSANT